MEKFAFYEALNFDAEERSGPAANHSAGSEHNTNVTLLSNGAKIRSYRIARDGFQGITALSRAVSSALFSDLLRK